MYLNVHVLPLANAQQSYAWFADKENQVRGTWPPPKKLLMT